MKRKTKTKTANTKKQTSVKEKYDKNIIGISFTSHDIMQEI